MSDAPLSEKTETAKGPVRTAIYDKHIELGAKMVPFAGYEMPLHYQRGILAEHNHVREAAGLFDVSHMGQAFIVPEDGTFKSAAEAMETLCPADLQSLKPGQQRYTQLLNDQGGIIDDLMIARMGLEGYQHLLYLVVNAGCKDKDYRHIAAQLPDGVLLSVRDNVLSLFALQGPKAVDAMSIMNSETRYLEFMQGQSMPMFGGFWAQVTRSGYTGEDGFEISIKHEDAISFANAMLTLPDVEMIGLGARDSLRLEAGLCLYGNDIDESVSPVEAGLIWSIPKSRRSAQAGYHGADRIAADIANKLGKRLVGILPDGRAPARAHTKIHDMAGLEIGEITSGLFGPSVAGPIAMGYVPRAMSKAGTPVSLIVRGKPRPAKIVKLPFVPRNYYRGA